MRDQPSLGSLRDRVEIFSNTQSVDTTGGLVDNFVSSEEVWARVQSKAGVLNQESDGRNARSNHLITLRYRVDIKPGDRILYRGLVMEIISVRDLNGRRAYLVCDCIETDSTG